MGCDIHPFLEIRSRLAPGRKRYTYIGMLERERNYMLFALLAGVRMYAEFPKADPQFKIQEQMPQDASRELTEEFADWGFNAHSLVIMPYEGLLQVSTKWIGEKRIRESSIHTWLKVMQAFEDAGFETRVVAWFDN